MSVKIKKSTITMTRGDTLKVQIAVTNAAGEPYIPAEGDSLRFAAKKNYTDEVPCILKDIPIDTCVLHLEPSDTKDLEQPYSYVYDIQLTMSDGTVDTFIKGVLKITEEVD